MSDTRTKVDALKDLGEKLTGEEISIGENETVVSMIDKIVWNWTYYIDLDMDGNKVLDANNNEVEFDFPKRVKGYLVDPIGSLIYSGQGYTYVPVPGDHADKGQYGYYDGCTFRNGKEKYDFSKSPNQNTNLVAHTTYGYWQGFTLDFEGTNRLSTVVVEYQIKREKPCNFCGTKLKEHYKKNTQTEN